MVWNEKKLRRTLITDQSAHIEYNGPTMDPLFLAPSQLLPRYEASAQSSSSVTSGSSSVSCPNSMRRLNKAVSHEPGEHGEDSIPYRVRISRIGGQKQTNPGENGTSTQRRVICCPGDGKKK